MNGIDLNKILSRLSEFDALRSDDTINTGTVDRIQPQVAEAWPDELDSSVRDALMKAGITQPYQHQADAIVKSLSGADVVMESPTASGKTLAFTAPMLHSLVRNEGSHALMIYPMKALALDQRAQIEQFCEPLAIDSWPYDGDTSTRDKKTIRESPPHILLTNPEYLNTSFLAWRELWKTFLPDLRYVIIDEMHEYRGFFGSNMALLLRRFFLQLARLGVTPKVFLSTATCANPQEHAKALTGREVAVVSARNVLRPKRDFVFVKPEIPDHRYWDIFQLRIEQAALAMMSEGLQTLVFCPSKRFLSETRIRCQEKAEAMGLDTSRIAEFTANLKAIDKQKLQERIKSGDVEVVFATNALELGVDIGGLDAVILAGFPPSIMSAWQQIGRAGRSWDRDALVLFYALNDPIDRFFVGNLDAFLNKPFDELVIDPANEQLIENHLPSVVHEIDGKSLNQSETFILGKEFANAVPNDPLKLPVKHKPQPRIKLRGGIGRAYDLRRSGEDIGQIDGMRRFREAYLGAIFPFNGRRYRVHSHEETAVVLADVEQYLRTDAHFYTSLFPGNDLFDALRYDKVDVIYGSVNIGVNFTGYREIDERTNEEVRSGGTPDALNEYNLHAFSINIPDTEDAGAVGALEHMLRVGAMFVIPADRFDTSTFSKTGGDQSVFYYENYPGGIGVARKIFAVWQTALEEGIEIARNCPCRTGCQNCIEPAKSYNMSTADIDKMCGIELAERLLEIARRGPTAKYRDGMMKPV